MPWFEALEGERSLVLFEHLEKNILASWKSDRSAMAGNNEDLIVYPRSLPSTRVLHV